MHKLRLSLDALQVESFETVRETVEGTGTVRGHAKATYGCTAGWDGCAQETVEQHTCNPSDVNTDCGFSCVYMSCDPMTCGTSCETGSYCQSFNPCTAEACVF
jgi:hypothetical protein